jgi:hypothetical protein
MNSRLLGRAWKHAAACVACLSLVTVVGCDGFELPTPPDMSALVKAYQKPDGELDADNAEQLAEEIGNCVDRTRNGAPIELVSSLVGRLQKIGGGGANVSDDESAGTDGFDYQEPSDVGAGEQSVSGNKIDIGASVRVHHVCRGWDEIKHIDADVNGTAELNFALDRRGLLPTVWGRLDHCRLKRSELQLELTGDLRVHFGTNAPRVGLQVLKEIGYLVEFDGTVQATRGDETIEVETGLNFRVFPNGQIQLKVDLADGTNVILALDPTTLQPISEPMLQAGLLTRNGIWACKLNLDDVNGSCVDDASADSVVTW